MDDREVNNALCRKSYWKNRDERLRKARLYRENNREKLREQYKSTYRMEARKAYIAANKGKYAAYAKKSYWKKKGLKIDAHLERDAKEYSAPLSPAVPPS